MHKAKLIWPFHNVLLLALFLGYENIWQCPRTALYLKWIGQYIKQAVHSDFADSAKILAWKAWSSALNQLNETVVITAL